MREVCLLKVYLTMLLVGYTAVSDDKLNSEYLEESLTCPLSHV